MRTNGVYPILEIGRHDGKDWVKEEFKMNINDEHILFSISQDLIALFSSEFKYESENRLLDNGAVYVLNYDCKKMEL